jgi:hypothetical protein
MRALLGTASHFCEVVVLKLRTSTFLAKDTQRSRVVEVRKVDIRLPGKGNLDSHGARPVHQIISMIKWIRTSRFSIRNSLSGKGRPLQIA